jgi:hypothetical protein
MRLRRVIRSGFVGCVCALSVAAQNWISVGVKGGVPLTDPIGGRTYNVVIATIPNPFGPPSIVSQTTMVSSGSRRLVLGPTLELQLPFGLAVEADALYRPMSVNVQSTTPLGRLAMIGTTLVNRVDTWEIPFLAKYRLPVPVIKPYVEAGPNFRAISASLAQHMSARGFSAGIGVESHIGPLRIAPEVRYTHWGSDGSYATPYHAKSYPNQLEFLAGLATAPADSRTSLAGKEWRRHISLGVKGGLPFTGGFLVDEFDKVSYRSVSCGDFSNIPCTNVIGTVQTYTASRNYLVGPLVEVHLPRNLSIEADALYHPLSLAAQPDPRLLQLPSIKTFSSWEFPIVGKYKFRAPFARPYLEAGPTFRAGSSQYHHYLASAGVTAGLGVEASVWRVHIAPEVRFVHWGHDASNAAPFYLSKRNQAQFLLGLSY